MTPRRRLERIGDLSVLCAIVAAAALSPPFLNAAEAGPGGALLYIFCIWAAVILAARRAASLAKRAAPNSAPDTPPNSAP